MKATTLATILFRDTIAGGTLRVLAVRIHAGPAALVWLQVIRTEMGRRTV